MTADVRSLIQWMLALGRDRVKKAWVCWGGGAGRQGCGGGERGGGRKRRMRVYVCTFFQVLNQTAKRERIDSTYDRDSF